MSSRFLHRRLRSQSTFPATLEHCLSFRRTECGNLKAFRGCAVSSAVLSSALCPSPLAAACSSAASAGHDYPPVVPRQPSPGFYLLPSQLSFFRTTSPSCVSALRSSASSPFPRPASRPSPFPSPSASRLVQPLPDQQVSCSSLPPQLLCVSRLCVLMSSASLAACPPPPLPPPASSPPSSLPGLILPSTSANNKGATAGSFDSGSRSLFSRTVEQDHQAGGGSSPRHHDEFPLSLCPHKDAAASSLIGAQISGSAFLDSVDVLLFDCDGVLWHGDRLLPGIRNLLESLQHPTGKEENTSANTRLGNGTSAVPKRTEGEASSESRKWTKRFYFLTNNSTKSRRGFLKKLESLGFPHVQEEQVICTAYVAACFLDARRQELREKKKDENAKDGRVPDNKANEQKEAVGKTQHGEGGPIDKIDGRDKDTVDCLDDSLVYVIGEQGLVDELQAKGFKTLGGPSDSGQTLDFMNDRNLAVDYRKDVSTVVVGLDRAFNYYKLQYAQLCLNFNKGSLFLATNRDALGNFTPTQVWAGAGGMVAAVEAVTRRKAMVVGKPSDILREYILRHVLGDTPLCRVCLVGDRLDTDIRFAQRLGIRSVLALTGVTDVALLQRQIEIRENQSKFPQLCDQRHQPRGDSGMPLSPSGSKASDDARSATQHEGGQGDSPMRKRRLDVDERDPGLKGVGGPSGGQGVAGRDHDVDFIIPDFVIETAAHLVM